MKLMKDKQIEHDYDYLFILQSCPYINYLVFFIYSYQDICLNAQSVCTLAKHTSTYRIFI